MFEEIIHIAKEIIMTSIIVAMQFLSVMLGFVEDIPIPSEKPIPDVVVLSATSSPEDTSPSTTPSLPTPKPRTPPTSTQEPIAEETVSPPSLPNEGKNIPEISPFSEETANELAREALVNIFCTTRVRGGMHATSGSGMIIDSRGVILTNAHVAQYFLLEDDSSYGQTDCVIRTGAPAEKTYDATPLFISSSWIEKNANVISEHRALGTGEYDIALLLIHESLTRDTLPDTFPSVSLRAKNDTVYQGLPMLVAGYPAEFLSGSTITRDLWPVTALADVLDVYTFGDDTVDIFSVEGNIAAQQGSSGGGIIDIAEGTLAGIVVTSSSAEHTEDRALNAVTTRHIDTTFQHDTDMSLSSYLSGDIEKRAEDFMDTTAPDLRAILLEIIEK